MVHGSGWLSVNPIAKNKATELHSVHSDSCVGICHRFIPRRSSSTVNSRKWFPRFIPRRFETPKTQKKKRWMFFSWRWSWVGKIAKCLLKTTFIFFNLTVAAALKSVASQLRKLEGIQWEKFHEKNATIYDITFCMHAWQSKYQVAKKPCEKRCFAHFHKNKHNYITIYTFYIFYIIII